MRGSERIPLTTTGSGAAGIPGLDEYDDDDAHQPHHHHHHRHHQPGGWNPGAQNDKPAGLLLGGSVSLPNLGAATRGLLGDGPVGRRLAGER